MTVLGSGSTPVPNRIRNATRAPVAVSQMGGRAAHPVFVQDNLDDSDGPGRIPPPGGLTSRVSVFVMIERRSTHPLLPLRIVLDRNRGGSYLSVLISGAGLFGVFLFLTYYLQKTLGYSPVVTGLAFLPMVAMIVIGSTTSNAVLLPRFGPSRSWPPGWCWRSLGMVLLAQIGVHSTYAGHILPALLIIGLGLGLIFAPSINTATLGVSQDDAGVASATVNSCQQVGGSIGTAVPEHDRDDCGGELPRRQDPVAGSRGPGRCARLHGRVLVGGRHLRPRRGGFGDLAAPRRGHRRGRRGGATGGGDRMSHADSEWRAWMASGGLA